MAIGCDRELCAWGPDEVGGYCIDCGRPTGCVCTPGKPIVTGCRVHDPPQWPTIGEETIR